MHSPLRLKSTVREVGFNEQPSRLEVWLDMWRDPTVSIADESILQDYPAVRVHQATKVRILYDVLQVEIDGVLVDIAFYDGKQLCWCLFEDGLSMVDDDHPIFFSDVVIR